MNEIAKNGEKSKYATTLLEKSFKNSSSQQGKIISYDGMCLWNLFSFFFFMYVVVYLTLLKLKCVIYL